MQLKDEDKPYDDINITPMLDLAYVLLIIFIILTTASVQGIKVDLPKASASVSLAKPQTKAITINNSGQIFLDAYPVTLPELEARLRTQRALTPDFPVIVKGDSAVQYQKVMDVLDLLRRIGDREAAALAAAEKDETLEPGRIGHRLEIAEIGFKRQVLDSPIRQAAPPAVVSCHGIVLRHLDQPRPPDRTLPIEFEVVEPG